jgi:colanic acid biosynthesis glycosyl transferase WcaI
VLCGLPNYPKGELFPGYSWKGPYNERHCGVRIFRVPEIPRRGNSGLRIFLNYVSFPLASLFRLPALMFQRYDRIFIYQLSPVMMSIAGIVLGRIKRVQTTMYVLDLWPENLFSVLPVENPLARRLATAVSHWHYRQVDKLVVLSSLMKRRVLEASKLDPGKVAVLPQACEKFYEVDIADESLTERFSGRFNVVFTGNMSPAQSFETMIEAAELLRERGHQEVRWIIVGDGMSRREIELSVESRGLGDCFEFVGQVSPERIPAYTTIADVLVGCLVKSALLEATIPAKVLSYVAAGRPVVLAMDGEVGDLIRNSACGLVGPAGDAHALAANLESILSLPVSERRQLGDNARKYHFMHLERNIVLGKLTDFVFKP